MPIARAARATSSSNRPACAAYKEFEARVGTIASARGAKRELVRRAIAVLPPRFTVADLNVAEICRYAMSESALTGPNPHVVAWYERCHDRPAFREMWAARALEG